MLRLTDRLDLDMDHLLLLLLLLWSSGVQAEGQHKSTEPVEFRLVGGDSTCAGKLELKHEGDWRPVDGTEWNLRSVAVVVCRELDCGSAVSVEQSIESTETPVWRIRFVCVRSGSALPECLTLSNSSYIFNLTCLDSVRLVDGTGLCSGRLEVRSDQSNQTIQSNQSNQWSSVCEADFDQQDAEVVCRQLGCGPPSVLQGGLYGELEAPTWTRVFQCRGHESALLDCRSSDSTRNTCSPGRAAGLTCSEPESVRLVGGVGRCAGKLELYHEGDWRPASDPFWTLRSAAAACRELDCGSAVSAGHREESSVRPAWEISSDCVQSGSALKDCVTGPWTPSSTLTITCSDSVRLVDGTSLCSGRLEVRSDQSNQSNQWSSVCEADFDQQDAEVVCRQLGCGPPSIFQGGLYGELEAPTWTREFRCRGYESALLDCGSSDSTRNTCSPGRAAGLTCSEPIRLVGGDSTCAGTLEVKQGDWKPVGGIYSYWTLQSAAEACKQLDCGSAVSTGLRRVTWYTSAWRIISECVQPGSALRECLRTKPVSPDHTLEITCSNSVRLVDGTSLCSGRLEVRSDQSNQSNQWSSVCEADFDQQDAEVVCRQLGCGPPSVLQGGLYGELKAPTWTREFQCRGHESALLDCGSSDSTRNTCSPGRAAGLTCSDPLDLRLVGEGSRCTGVLELKHDKVWIKVYDSDWTLTSAAEVCRRLHCGNVVSTASRSTSSSDALWISSECVRSGSAPRECVRAGPWTATSTLHLTCLDQQLPPPIVSVDGVSEALQQGFQVFRGSSFTISCSIQPQFPGGSFQLSFTSSDQTHGYTQLAVNHSAHFLFPAAEPAHQGRYTCVYHVYVLSHNFSIESRRLSLTVSAKYQERFSLIIRIILLPLILLLVNMYFYSKATRGQRSDRQEDTELVNYDLGASAAEGAQGAE
ncbi:scavenger receptor cysteine-rich type 1 protein M130-like [Anabas testudineus]|uniref:scavenger receptor cysteine-rich type 1 protein M130-like n=1 Tax=Anabas testudineus TaxID=64144 RepID=UPI000E45BF70|nr:scavenger receptor cysteine-rich type 1 protein M130-like [Anabas testudineus]